MPRAAANFEPQRRLAAALPGVIAAPYLARAVHARAGHGLKAKDLNHFIRRSHTLVASKLTQRLRQEIGLLT